jgi:sugar/nucleoside kinase (ribokinase family)
MTRPSYGVLSHLVVDVLATGGEHLGGAGLYAALGLRMSSRQGVVPSSGVGRDFLGAHADFFARWDLDAAGLDARSEQTPRTLVSYRPDGGREERSLLGDAHFASMAPRLADLVDHGTTPIGLYVFQDAEPSRWCDVDALRRGTGCPVLWELSALEHGPVGWRRVAVRLADVDIISVNLDEADALIGTRDPAAIVHKFISHGAKVVALRAGERGSYVASGAALLHVAPAPAARLVDPTGAGNAYSGAFLGAWVETGSLELAGRTAAAAASFVLEQLGPPPAPPAPERFASRLTEVSVITSSHQYNKSSTGEHRGGDGLAEL